MYEESSDAKNTTVLAISDGSAKRPRGTLSVTVCLIVGLDSQITSTIDVSVVAGWTEFTLILSLAEYKAAD